MRRTSQELAGRQCREGWHLEDEPDLSPDPATDDQQWWVVLRAEAQQSRDQAADDGQDTADFDALIAELDEEITRPGVRGKVLPDRPARRHRSTRRRQDAPDLPRRKVNPRTLGKSYTAPDGKTFRPSMFVTLTCPSYGRVDHRGVPVDPASYDYDRAARDALTFAALFDRFIQNLRRYLGYDVQYFAAVEPQRRLAPHVHIAIRGTIARSELRRVLAATYHQVWWPDTARQYRDSDQLPVWDDQAGRYLDPATGEILPTWDEALDAIGSYDLPWHVARFGDRFDAQGVLAGSKDAARCIGYLTKYLTKQVGGCHQAATGPSPITLPGWPRRCATSRAHRGARTGSGTASSPRTPGPARPPARARAKPTTPITSATPGGGSWSPASGPARPWPTTAPTARNGCCGRSVFRQPTRPGTPGSWSPRPTTIIWTTPGGCCTSSPTGSDGKPRSPKPDVEQLCTIRPIFRQPGGQRDGQESRIHRCLRRGDCAATSGSTESKADQ